MNYYDAAIFDNSIFISKFPSDIQRINFGKVYIPNNASTLLPQIKKLLSTSEKSNLQHNSKMLTSINFIKGNAYDTYSLIWKCTEKYYSLLVTGNKTLITQLIFSNIDNLDIYDISENKIIHNSEFYKLREQLDIKGTTHTERGISKDIHEGSTLYLDDGSTVTLGKHHNSEGKEATIWRVANNKNIIIKLFYEMADDKKRNLINLVTLNKKFQKNWVALPQNLVFSDSSRKKLVGFTEPFIDNVKECFLDEDVYNNAVEDKESQRQKVLKDSLMLTSQYYYLSHYGLCISDFNLTNFSHRSDTNRVIQMWDSDSFMYKDYFSELVGRETYLSHSNVEKPTKGQCIDICSEQLYHIVFYMVSFTYYPVIKDSDKYFLDDEKCRYKDIENNIPNKLMVLFNDSFRGKHFSVEKLLYVLSDLVNSEQSFDNAVKNTSPSIGNNINNFNTDIFDIFNSQKKSRETPEMIKEISDTNNAFTESQLKRNKKRKRKKLIKKVIWGILVSSIILGIIAYYLWTKGSLPL